MAVAQVSFLVPSSGITPGKKDFEDYRRQYVVLGVTLGLLHATQVPSHCTFSQALATYPLKARY